MRGIIPDLESAVPLLHQLPGVLQDDDFTQRFVGAFDDGLAPILTTLDSLSGYIDPWLAPADFLEWLAGWVSIELDDAWRDDQKRAIVADAAVTHRRRGTLQGMVDALELALNARVEVIDSGACAWSATPGDPIPGDDRPSLTVRIHAADPDQVDLARAESLVADLKPAHVAHHCEAVPASANDTETEDGKQP